MNRSSTGFLKRQDLQQLLDVLQRMGYRCIGPQVKEGAIVYAELDQVQQLPWGVHVQQAPGQYRLQQQEGNKYFTWANGPQALKPLLFRPKEDLWHSRSTAQGLSFEELVPQTQALAVIGVRACDLAALQLQDQHFLQGPNYDPYYAARRQSLFLVAVNCTHPADTCFCASTGDGPEAIQGFDLAMDELDGGYLVAAGSAAGEAVLPQLPLNASNATQRTAAKEAIQKAVQQQTRQLPGRNLRDSLFKQLQHPRWQQVAARCLSCANCTSVCPTCFCHSEADEFGLSGVMSTHYRQWDSCFTPDHSYIHGIVIRSDTSQRYRQWMTHKLGSWHDQYGRSGCVGCGRCISWCPVGIDITEEATAICAGDGNA